MSDDEAYDVLGGTTSTVSHELVGLAQGWPAVLGLASTSGVSAPELVSAPHLYRFFADEIYRRMSRATRELLCELALYDAPSRAKFLLRQPPQLAERVVRVGIDRGFIVEASEARIEIHPLLRAFLESKLRQDAPDHVRPTVERAARDLITHGLWDDAYDLIQRFEASDLLPELIGASHAALLEVGRVATLRTWLQKAPEDASSVQLAAAELAFREGRFRESETLALLVTRKSNESPSIVAQGFIVAGRAAHAASQLEDAATYYRLAREGATSDRVIRDALFGELAAANELERTSEARKLLDALSEIGDLSPSDQVILADRRLNFESHNGIACSINDARSAWQLLPYVKDPIARSSFRNVLGYALVASCKLDEATAITAEQLEDVDRCRLDFVIPYALVIQALTSYIRHDYVSADALIDEAEDRAVAAGDRTARHIAMAARCRILNAQGAHNLTLSRPLDADVNLTPWLRAELASCHAVAFAAQGRAQQAESTAAEAEVLSLSPEVRINVACARAIAAIQGGDSRAATTHAQVALDAVGVSRVLEPFISAYRGYPNLAAALLNDPDSRDRILDILATAGDQVIADAVPDPRASSALLLSPREREVLALVSQGLSNPEIGKQLFISPVTVKVHVRHIFEKLGVHSRAQAAVRGSQLTRTHATPATRAAAGRD